MEKKFGELMQVVWSHKTPAMPKILIIRPMVKSKKISAKDQQDYQLGAVVPGKTLMPQPCQCDQGTVNSKCQCKPCYPQETPMCYQVCAGHEEPWA